MPFYADSKTNAASAVAARSHKPKRGFDGIICFGGEDWWYHNRGHFDMQMMRQFAAHLPVLYVNSIGMRMPTVREGRMFARRITRKLRSITHGLHRIDDSYAVFSPLVAPTGPLHRLTMPALPVQVRAAAGALNINNPLLWIACPTAAPILDSFADAPVVYQRTDLYEQFKGVDPVHIHSCDAFLKARADLTVFCSPTLLAREADQCCRASLVGHGVDLEHFASAGDGNVDQPDDVRDLPKPRVGFIGGIDAHTFDPELFNAVVAQVPEAHFVLVGSSSLPANWCKHSNVTMLGQKPFEQVHAYMGSCDVLIMPWARNNWIQACNPVKLKEYLAVGRPIVSTPFGALQRYQDVVHVAETASEFAASIKHALNTPGDVASRRSKVIGENWTSKAHSVLRRLMGAGITSTGDVHLALAHTIKNNKADNTCVEVKPGTFAPVHKKQPSRIPKPVSNQKPVTSPQSASDSRLAGCILLAGGMRPSPLVTAAGCTVLDLWLTKYETVLDCWLNGLRAMPSITNHGVPVRVVSSPTVPSPWPRQVSGLNLTYELEPRSYRGTAGLLHDLCCSYPADEHVLIIEAARYATCNFEQLWRDHARSGADITIACNADGALAGVYIVRCGCFEDVADIGFTDFKEQFLSRAAKHGRMIRTCTLTGGNTMPLWCRQHLLEAAAMASSHAQQPCDFALRTGILTSVSDYGLQIICDRVRVASSATVVDSILMPGTVVEDGACIVRSVICMGCHIQAGADIADAIASPHGLISDTAEATVSGLSPYAAASNDQPIVC